MIRKKKRSDESKHLKRGKVTTSTLASNRIKSEENEIVVKSPPVLKKSLSFSILEI
jgi:hypothetical protein